MSQSFDSSLEDKSRVFFDIYDQQMEENHAGNYDLVLAEANNSLIPQILNRLDEFSFQFEGIALAQSSLSVGFYLQNNQPLLTFGHTYLDFITCLNKNIKQNSSSIITISNDINIDKAGVSYIGFQRHLVQKSILDFVESEPVQSVSLGMLRNSPQVIEPIFRQASFVNINLNVLKKCEVPAISSALPTGLTSEELCQMCRYAGASESLKWINIETGSTELTEHEVTILAELLWYLIEGIYYAQTIDSTGWDKNIIQIQDIDAALYFYHDEINNKWWVSLDEDSVKPIPCLYEEYKLAGQGILADRLMRLLLV